MTTDRDSLAERRFVNAMSLFDEFVCSNVKHADAATLRGLEGRFALRLQIQPSYWSQIKARSRQIGDRLARRFEPLCHKPPGWLDRPVGPAVPGSRLPSAFAAASPEKHLLPVDGPRNDDERFIVGLALTLYRRHPQRARARLLELLEELLNPAGDSASPPIADAASAARFARRPARGGDGPADSAIRTAQGVAPLRRRR